jgi:hypothetical protein
MALFGKLFGTNEDPLKGQAETLVSAAQINAVGSFTPLLDKFDFLRDIKPDNWDYFVTVATVFMGASRLNNLGVSEEREDKLMEIVAGYLNEWNRDGIRGFEDCKGLFESEFDRLTQAGHDPKFVASDSVGNWIVWNILGRAPQSDDECMLVRTIGAMVTHSVFDWWNK